MRMRCVPVEAVHWCILELSVVCLLYVSVCPVRIGVALDGMIVISPIRTYRCMYVEVSMYADILFVTCTV